MTTPATMIRARAGNQTVAGVGYGLTAAVAYGSAQVLARQGVSDLAPPLVGSLLALFWGTLGFSLFAVRNFQRPATNFRRGALFFAAAGIFSAMGVVLLFQALSRGEVVVVSPVAATNPLFTLVLAALFLRGVERITWRIVLGAVLVVAGVVVLTAA
jgi:drug/metabolite transporter (DMT)-like permease